MSIAKLLTSDMLTRVTAVSLVDMALTVALSLLLGLFIFYIYRRTFQGVLYSASFGLSLVALCMISAMLILAVSSNIVLSLGMVGALSIVRFRTAIKEPLDIVFLFWTIAAGIIVATGMIPLAVIGSLAIGIAIEKIPAAKAGLEPYLVVAHLASDEPEEELMRIIGEATDKSRVKGKSIQSDGRMELTVEVRLKEHKSRFIQQIAAVEGVQDVVLVAYNGEYMS